MSSKYQKGQIYKIVDVGFNKCYIGSTCESLSQRMVRHRVCYKSFLKGTSGRMRSFDLFDEYGIENCKIVWIEDYPCESRKQLEAREGYYIENTDCVNRCQLGRTRAEYSKLYREKYPEQVKEAKKKCHFNNPDKQKKRSSKYYQKHKEHIEQKASEPVKCECGLICRKDSLTRHRKCKRHQDYLEQMKEI